MFLTSLYHLHFFFNPLENFIRFILDKFISAVRPFGITLLKLSSRPPPVIFAQDLINF